MDDKDHPGSLVRLIAWARHPFSSGMSAVDWMLFLGLVIVASFLWTRVLSLITGAIKKEM